MSLFSPELVLFVLIPIAAGAVFGVLVRPRTKSHLPLLFAAPAVSTVAVSILFYLWEIGFLLANPQWRNPYPIYIQALGATALFMPGIALIGILPAIYNGYRNSDTPIGR